MNAIVLFSHGSVLCGAERNLIALAGRMRARGDAAIVEVAFLNYTEPSFRTAVERCIEQGATRIRIAPYFLIAGKFIIEDLPRVIAEAREEHPSIAIEVAQVIGFHPALAEAVVDSAREARLPGEWREELAHATAWCRESPKCPLYGLECGGEAAAFERTPRHESAGSAAAVQTILLMAHGSPRAEANEDVERVAALLREHIPRVVVGYLDCNEPDIPAAIDQCVASGATLITAVPYLLHSGRHFLLDLPRLLEEGAARHRGVELRMGDFVGRMPQMADVLRDRVEALA